MALSTRSTSSDLNFFFYDRGAVSENLSTGFYGREPIVKQTLTTLSLMLFLAPLLGAQRSQVSRRRFLQSPRLRALKELGLR
jgi:hypothetical protein